LKTPKNILQIAKQTILEESNAIANLIKFLDTDFENAVKNILHSKGRLIVTGIGKSANIATKIVATFNSTGTPSVFMHAADAIHGDLGNILKDDTIICISKSGNTPEIKVLIPLIKNNYKNTIIAITGNKDSFLGKNANFILNTFVEKEACPNNLAPTTSTTAQLVMGDALAVALLELRNFTSTDFAKYHPGGALGKKLYLRVSDLVDGSLLPKVNTYTSIIDTIVEISEKRFGATAVISTDKHTVMKVVGIITDGDIRRMLSKNPNFDNLQAKDIMSENPKTIDYDAMAVDALEIMEDNSITQLIVTKNNSYKGMIHLHELLKEGLI